MNETQIRERLRDAVGESSYPIYLTSQVEARLKSSAGSRRQRPAMSGGRSAWMPSLGRKGSLAAALLAVLLIAALVVGVNVWRNSGFNNAPLPSDQGRSIKQYQTMLLGDEKRESDAESNNCATLTDACPTAAGAVIAALQRWLDDLNGTSPPARFAYLDAQIRKHIALAISDMHGAITAYNAKDQAGMDSSIAAAIAQRDTIITEVDYVTSSSQRPIATYVAAVRLDMTNLTGCVACQQVISPNQMSCTKGQKQSCIDAIAAMRIQVETFQGDLVLVVSPNSLAAKDAILQADLNTADLALDAMDSAATTGDQSALNTGRNALRQAIGQVQADVLAITGGG